MNRTIEMIRHAENVLYEQWEQECLEKEKKMVQIEEEYNTGGHQSPSSGTVTVKKLYEERVANERRPEMRKIAIEDLEKAASSEQQSEAMSDTQIISGNNSLKNLISENITSDSPISKPLKHIERKKDSWRSSLFHPDDRPSKVNHRQGVAHINARQDMASFQARLAQIQGAHGQLTEGAGEYRRRQSYEHSQARFYGVKCSLHDS